MKLLIATRNQGKIKEIRQELKDLTYEIVGLDETDLPADYEVEEPALTMEGNAIIKAMTYGQRTGLLTMAEDAGLEVDALAGRPGVFSARYAPGTDQDRYLKLLHEMIDIPTEKRGAQFCAFVAIYRPDDGKIRTCRGVYRGRIITAPRGANGFGFDPIFLNEEKNLTNAEMTLAEKNQVSHRGQAWRLAKEILKQEF